MIIDGPRNPVPQSSGAVWTELEKHTYHQEDVCSAGLPHNVIDE